MSRGKIGSQSWECNRVILKFSIEAVLKSDLNETNAKIPLSRKNARYILCKVFCQLDEGKLLPSNIVRFGNSASCIDHIYYISIEK